MPPHSRTFVQRHVIRLALGLLVATGLIFIGLVAVATSGDLQTKDDILARTRQSIF